MTVTMTSPPSAAPPSKISTDDITLEFIDPVLAEVYLGKNFSNRHLRPGHYKALASDMTGGRWQQTHMAIAFDTDGNLIDSQHRMHAVIESGIGQWFIVVRNVPKAVQEVIDAGAARSAADALKLSNRVDKNHPAVAAAARIAILWGEGHHRMVRPNVNGSRKVTNSEITSWVDDQLTIPAGGLSLMGAVAEAVKWHQVNSLMSLSVSSFAFMLLGGVDYNAALDFFNNLDDLNFTGDDDPIKQLYLRLNDAKAKKEGLRVSQYLWFVVTAWNAFRDGVPLADPFVRYLSGGSVKSYNPKEKVKGGVKIVPLVPDPI